MLICPQDIIIKRTEEVGSDKFDLLPTNDIASIKSIEIHMDETIRIKLLGFHVNEKVYCDAYKIQGADKRYCETKKSKYIHFLIDDEGFLHDESMFVLAFLPRSKADNEIEKIVKELCEIINFFEIKQNINCIIFRFGKPIHDMDNLLKWQKVFDRKLIEINKNNLIKVYGRIKHVREGGKKCLTIRHAALFDSINVS